MQTNRVQKWQIVMPKMTSILVNGVLGRPQPQPYLREYNRNGSVVVKPYNHLHLFNIV
jgi:hypothetical protein